MSCFKLLYHAKVAAIKKVKLKKNCKKIKKDEKVKSKVNILYKIKVGYVCSKRLKTAMKWIHILKRSQTKSPK